LGFDDGAIQEDFLAKEALQQEAKSRRGLLNWAANSRVGGMAHNLAREVPRLKVREEGYHSWAEQEGAKFEARHKRAFRVCAVILQ
jgi:hypothetical protein